MTMSNEPVHVLNLNTGRTGTVSRKWFENPAINAGILIEVDKAQKPYVPELYKSKIDPAPVEVEEDTDSEKEMEEAE